MNGNSLFVNRVEKINCLISSIEPLVIGGHKNCLFVVSPKLFIQLYYYFPPHPVGHKHGLQSSNVANHSFRFYGTLSTYIRSRGRGGGLVVTVSTCTRLGKGYLHLGLYQKYIPRE